MKHSKLPKLQKDTIKEYQDQDILELEPTEEETLLIDDYKDLTVEMVTPNRTNKLWWMNAYD